MSFVRFTPVMRFYWDVFRLSYAGHTFLSVCLAFDHACCLPHSAKQNGLRYVAFLFRRGSRSPFVRSRMSCGYQALLVHFGIACFLAAIPTGLSGPLGYGTGGAAFVRFCVTALALSCFPPGVRWGCAPQTAPKSLRLSGLSSFDSRCGGVSRGEGGLGYNEDLTGSNLWPGKSCGRLIAPAHAIH